jgi:GH43 family beta-xylosidase
MGLLGPGHHSVTRGPAGGRVIVYHNTYQTDPIPRREVRAAPLCVDDDGNFFVGPP